VVDKKIDHRMRVAKMRMLKWMSEVTIEDRIRNKHIKGSIRVTLKEEEKEEDRRSGWMHLSEI